MLFTNLDQFLKFLHDQKRVAEHKSWVQVGALTPGEKLAHRGVMKDSEGKAREIELLMKRAMNLQGEIEILRDQFWNDLYRDHALPADANYHITPDGRILTEPKK